MPAARAVEPIRQSNISAPYPSLTQGVTRRCGCRADRQPASSTTVAMPAEQLTSTTSTTRPTTGRPCLGYSSPFQGGGSVTCVLPGAAVAARSWKPGSGGIDGAPGCASASRLADHDSGTRHFGWRPVLCGALILSLAITPATSTAAEIQRCDQARPFRDLNGDGFEDAVVGDPFATVNSQTEAGSVAGALRRYRRSVGEGTRRPLTQADLGETPEAGDRFGWAVEMNRTTIGGCFGILIGSPPYRRWISRPTPGMAHVFTFAPVFEDRPDEELDGELRPG